MKHKTALVSAMSIAGVVLAGATAVMANVGILTSSQGLGQVSAVDPVTTSTPTTTIPSQPTTPQADLVAYQINGVGVVTIARQGHDLALDSADVGSWSYEVSGQGETLGMAFRFEGREVQFEATLIDGQIVVDVWEEQVIVEAGSTSATAPATQATSVTTAPPATSGTWDDDDGFEDDDGYEDEDDHEYDDDDASYDSDDSSYESDGDDGGDDDD